MINFKIFTFNKRLKITYKIKSPKKKKIQHKETDRKVASQNSIGKFESPMM